MSENATVSRQIGEVVTRWLDLVKAKDGAAISELYTPDGRLCVPHMPIVEGRAALANAWNQLLSLPGCELSFGPTRIEAAASGDLAWELGTYSLRYHGEKGRVDDRGKYVVVWKKSGETWQATADILNSDLPPPG